MILRTRVGNRMVLSVRVMRMAMAMVRFVVIVVIISLSSSVSVRVKGVGSVARGVFGAEDVVGLEGGGSAVEVCPGALILR